MVAHSGHSRDVIRTQIWSSKYIYKWFAYVISVTICDIVLYTTIKNLHVQHTRATIVITIHTPHPWSQKSTLGATLPDPCQGNAQMSPPTPTSVYQEGGHGNTLMVSHPNLYVPNAWVAFHTTCGTVPVKKPGITSPPTVSTTPNSFSSNLQDKPSAQTGSNPLDVVPSTLSCTSASDVVTPIKCVLYYFIYYHSVV